MKLKIKLIVITLSLLGAVGISAQEKPSGETGSEKANINTSRANKGTIKDKDNYDDSAEELKEIAIVTWDGKAFKATITDRDSSPVRMKNRMKSNSSTTQEDNFEDILKMLKVAFPQGFPPEVKSASIHGWGCCGVRRLVFELAKRL